MKYKSNVADCVYADDMSVKVKSGSVIPAAQLNKETNLTESCFQKCRLRLIYTNMSSIVLSDDWVRH
jgi:hypothetical protein